jgi:[NiFe] hydrogenase assembly HybE family chaperone
MVIGAATLSEEDSVQRLANAYRRAALKVKGLPIYNPTIAVEAVGFREYEGRQVGVIVTPWFMNLTALPSESDLKAWLAGRSTMLGFPSGAYEFTVTDLQDVGLIATCSLFSTMLDFTDHEAAQLAAKTVADAVFEPEQPAPAPTVSRRQLLGG